MNFYLFIITTTYLISTCESTLSKSDKSPRRAKTTTKKPKPSDTSTNDYAKDTDIFKKGLIKKDIVAQNILENFENAGNLKNSKQFGGDVLAYITPWNSHGYDIAKLFGAKFTHISPVWLQLKREAGRLVVRGDHDIDKGWIKETNKSRHLQFTPRILFDGWTAEDWQWLFSDEKNVDLCADKMVEFSLEHGFDGIVLELWSQFGGQYSNLLIHLIGRLSHAFRKERLTFILVIPPSIDASKGPAMITPADFASLVPLVDRFSLMTYDYSSRRPGPSSPISWMRQCVELLAPQRDSDARRKILLGLNFYGMDFQPQRGAEPIIGNSYIDLIRKHSKSVSWSWDENSAEHTMIFKSSNRQVFFPTLLSIERRVKLAIELNVGLSIWEIGQGLDYFYDML